MQQWCASGHSLVLLLLWLARASTAEALFPQFQEKVGVGPAGAAGVISGVEGFGRPYVLLGGHLPDQFLGTRGGVEDCLGGAWPGLMRRHLHPDVAADRLLPPYPHPPV